MSAAAGLLVAAALAARPLVAQDLVVYDDQRQSGFEDWGWDPDRNYSYTGQHHSGSAAVYTDLDGWEGLYLHSNQLQNVSSFVDLRLWVKGETAGGQQLTLSIQSNGTTRASVALASYVSGGISGTTWKQAIIPFASIGLTDGTFNEIVIQDATGGNQSPELFDDVVFTHDPNPPGAVAVSVDPNGARTPVSEFIYGVSFATAQQIADVGYTVNRWGGNRTTRYNWNLDVDNSAFDWFYQNYAGTNGSNQADDFVTSSRGAGAQVVLTLPEMGRVAGPDRVRRWSFSQALYGPQLVDECSYFPPPPPAWCNPDAGNGLCDPAVNTTGHCSNDGRIVGNDPNDTSITVSPGSFDSGWLAHLASLVGDSGHGGMRFAALDNEPMLWNSTHADLHPAGATYDEVWAKGLAVAGAAKAQDPRLRLLGPDTWGWCDLFTSAADVTPSNCLDGPDRQAHGGVPFVEWYVGQICAHPLAGGARPIDLVDVHYYPQSGEAFGDESLAALRLQSIRELDDPSYVSQSWISANVRLLPRLRDWITTACPGTGIAVTEYNWGADDAPSGALAQAEILAIFAAQGVELATRWVAPDSGTKTEEAFKLYLDYDGAGSKVLGDDVPATSSDRPAVGAYAIRGPSDQLYVLLFNKDTAARDVDVSFAAGVAGPAALWRFTAATPLGSAGSVAVSGNAMSLTLPARSATLARLRVLSNLIFRDGFGSGSTWAWSFAAP